MWHGCWFQTGWPDHSASQVWMDFSLSSKRVSSCRLESPVYLQIPTDLGKRFLSSCNVHSMLIGDRSWYHCGTFHRSRTKAWHAAWRHLWGDELRLFSLELKRWVEGNLTGWFERGKGAQCGSCSHLVNTIVWHPPRQKGCRATSTLLNFLRLCSKELTLSKSIVLLRWQSCETLHYSVWGSPSQLWKKKYSSSTDPTHCICRGKASCVLLRFTPLQ